MAETAVIIIAGAAPILSKNRGALQVLIYLPVFAWSICIENIFKWISASQQDWMRLSNVPFAVITACHILLRIDILKKAYDANDQIVIFVLQNSDLSVT